MRKMMTLVLLFTLLMPVTVLAGRLHPKRWYQDRWCAKYLDGNEALVSDQYDCLSEK